jgi:hypothetical protein
MMGVSHDTLYRYQLARDKGDVKALLEKTRPEEARRVSD